MLAEIPRNYRIPGGAYTAGILRGKPMFGDRLNTAIKAFAKIFQEYKKPEISERFCWEIAESFSEFLWDWSIPNRIIELDLTKPRDRKKLPYRTVAADLEHKIVAVGSYRIDFAASQFSSTLPFPVIWKAR